MTATHNALLGALSRHSHFDEFSEHLNVRGNILTPLQRKALARGNLGLGELAVGAGVGITAGVGTIYQNSVIEIGGIIETRILLDLTGLSSATSDLDVIGVAGGPAHIGQITEAVNGTILGGSMQCLEVPSSLTDIDLYSSPELNSFEDLITSDTGEVALITSGAAWTAALTRILTGVPGADHYLYLVNGAADTADPFTAGKFLISLYGYRA